MFKAISTMAAMILGSTLAWSYPIPESATNCILVFQYEQVFGCVAQDYSNIHVRCNGGYSARLPALVVYPDVTHWREREAHIERFEEAGFLEWDSEHDSIDDDSGECIHLGDRYSYRLVR